jgi:hypothetical protein
LDKGISLGRRRQRRLTKGQPLAIGGAITWVKESWDLSGRSFNDLLNSKQIYIFINLF